MGGGDRRLDRKRAAKWAAIVGLVTAVLALATAFFSLQEKTAALHRQEEDLRRQELADARRRQAELEQQQALLQAQLAAAQKQRICDGHQANRSSIEQRFSDVQNSHSMLLNLLRQCMSNDTEDDRNSCAFVVCTGAIIFAKSNCVEVAGQVATIKEDLDRENAAAEVDGCEIPRSAIDEFLEG